MYRWVVYDIASTKRRARVHRICQDFGLLNVQKSVFVGMVDEKRFHRFQSLLCETVDPETDSLYLIPVERRGILDTVALGRDFDRKMALRELRIIFL